MTKLLSPSPGEILDRLTILSLKIVQGEQDQKDARHFRDEYDILVDAYKQICPLMALAHCHVPGLMRLHSINAALWQAEDDLRRARNAWPGKADPGGPQDWVLAVLADRIQSLNDQRAETIQAINVAAGLGQAQEKL